MARHISLLFLCLLFLFSCSNTANSNESAESDPEVSSETPKEEETTAPEPPLPANPVFLSGIYVTSQNMPHKEFSYENLFDGDEGTVWATMPGAGPGEGIMLYFDTPQFISSVEVRQAAGEKYKSFKQIEIYLNGQVPVLNDVDEGPFKVQMDAVSSLYIKVNGSYEDYVYEEEGSDFAIANGFPEDKSIGIAELILNGKEGPLAIVSPWRVPGTITASSTLEPKASYGARNLMDSRREFAWAEGDAGTGIGQSLSFNFESVQEFKGATVANGYQRSDKHFSSNASAKSLAFSDESGGSEEQALANEKGGQKLNFDTSLKGKQFKVEIKDAYPGEKYEDLLISELTFVSPTGRLVVIADPALEDSKKFLLASIEGSNLEGVIDKQTFNDMDGPDGLRRSLILRSDNTFVYYDDDWSGESLVQVVADGNWEIVEKGPDKSRVKVFGKLNRLSESSNPYDGGPKSTENRFIFHDYLTIEKGSVSGEKFIADFVLPE